MGNGSSSDLISLPKGGGALNGLGEKFSPDLFTGTGNFTIPIALPSGRNGFQPQLSLSFSTGNGNGAFGIGGSLSIPGVTRKTSKGIPRYRDNTYVPSLKQDIFILSGAEDLVPVDGASVGAQRYRPRTDGLFALIDHFHDADNDYWKVQSKDGLISYYGTPGLAENDPAVIAKPTDRRKVFSWKLSHTEDPFGNRIEYEYSRDQGDGSTPEWDQLYLKQIRYVDYTDSAGKTQYLATVDFLYDNDPAPPGGGAKKNRPDSFSEFRSGFQIRTRRRCKWIVVKTHPKPTQEQLVRAYEFVYLDERTDLPNLQELLPLNGASLLSQVDIISYDDGNKPARELPPLEFAFSRFEPSKRKFIAVTGNDLPPVSLGNPDFEMAGLFGNGLPDIFEMNDTVRYWRNLGGGRFDMPRSMPEAPAGLRLSDSGVQLIDANGDGRTDLLVTTAELSGYYSSTSQGGWDRNKSFQRYSQAPSFNLEDPEVRLVDLDGDGVTDAIRAGSRLECYFNDPHQGWLSDADHVRFVEWRSDGFPANFSDPRVKWADMTSDGMQDVVLIHNGRIDYWPNLGYGEFGPRVTMRNSPHLPFDYDPRRLLVGDVDGDDLADIIYVENTQITLWINQSGNGWSAPIVIHGTPPVTDMDNVRLVDLMGTGVSGVLWTQESRGDGRDRYFFFDFTGGVKPYLLTEMNNHIGAVTKVEYAPSTQEYLRDQANISTRWRTPLPFPVQVVSRVEVIDGISKGKLITEYSYHRGYWDGAEREFRGFGSVVQIDTVSFEKYSATGLHGEAALFAAVDRKYFSAPTLTKTWFHQGPVGEEFGDWEEQDYTKEYWQGDPQLLKHTEAVNAFLHTLPQRRIKRDALRTLRGSILRSELYALDGSVMEDRPYTVIEHAYGLREEDPPLDPASSRERIFFPYGTSQRTTQWERGDDPLTQFSFTGQYDAYGQPLTQSALAMPRRSVKRLSRRSSSVWDDAGVLATHTRTVYAMPGPTADRYIRNRVARSTSFTFASKPQIIETQPANALTVLRDQAQLAEFLHQKFEDDLKTWQPTQGNTGGYQVFAHAVNYYDGPAYQGKVLGKIGSYGALTRTESLILTDDILNQAYNDAIAQFRTAYLGGTAMLPSGAPANFGADHGYLDKRNNIAGYVPGYYVAAQQQKFDFQDGVTNPRGLPVAMRDALNHESQIDRYDDFHFLPLQVTDPKGMTISAEYNLRMLQPRKITDPNGNYSEVKFSPSGLVTETWIKGKNGEGDQSEPSSKLSYDFLAFKNTGKPIYARAIKRCHHDTETDVPPSERGKIIESREYSDGFGRVIQIRTQGEEVRFGEARLGGGESVLPADQNDGRGGPVVGIVNADPSHSNVVVSGWQVYDNKGKVVEKYEPFFSQGWECEPEADSRHGVHAEMYYDPRGQVIRTVNPDSSEQRVIYGVPNSLSDPYTFTPTPWEAYTYDPNDNAGRTHATDTSALSYQHHRDTPASIAIDTLGRTVRAVARHRDSTATAIEEHITESSYDIQGNLLTITDALGRRAFGYTYDLAKHALRTESIDAGTRCVVLNAMGNPIEAHDAKGAISLHSYDVINRPSRLWARDDASDALTLREKLIYGDNIGPIDPTDPNSPAKHNLLGKLYQHYDEAGVVTVAVYDFKGNVLESSRKVISDDFMLVNVLRAQTSQNWALRAPRVDWAAPPANILDAIEYRTRSAFDALNRIKWSEYPRAANGERYRLRPGYNRAGALERVELEGPLDTSGPVPSQPYVRHLAYNAKGQRTLVAYGNDLITRYAYDPKTFRLVRMRTEGYAQPSPLAYQPSGTLLQDLAYQYDLSSNILRITDRTPGSGVRNNPGALAYPELHPLLSAGDALVREFAYDPLYRLISATGRECSSIPDPPPVTDDARCGYNSGNHGTANQDNAPYMTSLYKESYEYDPAGNMLWLKHSRNGSNGFSRYFGMAGSKPKEWKEKVESFLAGNAPDLGSSGNRLTNFGNDEEHSTSHAYDANGNMVRENTERYFEWDHSDRMKVFRNQTGTSKPTTYALYLYDAGGQRVKKLVVTGNRYRTTTYLGAAFEHHTEQNLDGSGKIENYSLHVMDDKQRIAIQRVGDAFADDGAKDHPIQYHLGDHLGSSTIVVSGNGAWLNREEFFPYGETSFGSFGRKRYRYTGKERDEESGLSYHGARYFGGWLGRWISGDPSGPNDSINLYRFVLANPIRMVDPSGASSTLASAFLESAGVRTLDTLSSMAKSVALNGVTGGAYNAYQLASSVVEAYREGGGGANGVMNAVNSINPVNTLLTQGWLANEEAGKALYLEKLGDTKNAQAHAEKSGSAFADYTVGAIELGATVAGGVKVARKLGVPGTAQAGQSSAANQLKKNKSLGDATEEMFNWQLDEGGIPHESGRQRTLKDASGKTAVAKPTPKAAKAEARKPDQILHGVDENTGNPVASGVEVKANDTRNTRYTAKKELTKENEMLKQKSGVFWEGDNGQAAPWVAGEGSGVIFGPGVLQRPPPAGTIQ